MPADAEAPENLIIAALAELDSRMGISPDGREIQVKVSAIAKLLTDPPPMTRPLLKHTARG